MRLIPSMALFLLAVYFVGCSESGNQASESMTVQTTSSQYHATDTVHFTILNSRTVTVEVSACNGNLTSWIQKLESNIWVEKDSLNYGPCLALFGPVTLEPGKSWTGIIPLARLAVPQDGQRRIRLMYIYSGSNGTQNAYSNTFNVSN